MKKIQYFALLLFFFGASGCFKDLEVTPIDPDEITAAKVFKDEAAYKQFLAKCYAGLAVSGQQGPAGQADISGIDEGFGQYLRGYWYHQELPTDEAVIGWNDQTIKDFHGQSWSAADGFIYAFYSRVFYQVAIANEFLKETTDEKLASRGVGDALKNEIKTYRAEARFLRALSYYHALDLFRNVPFATENDPFGAIPRRIEAAELFAFIESELKEIENDLKAPRTNDYARADRAVSWALLAKLYLNAEVYTGQKKYQECLDVCDKIIGAGFKLDENYGHLFLADNHLSEEIIFPIAYDADHTRTYGGTTFIIFAGIGGSMKPNDSGVSGGWGGTRTTQQLVSKFPSNLTGIVTDFSVGKTVTYPKIYVPGSHQGFDPTDVSNSLSQSVANSKIYEGHKYFPANTQFYFALQPSNSAQKLGDNGGDGTLETNGANIQVPEAGYYYLRVDLNTPRSFVIEKREYAMVGPATGGTEIPFVWNPDTKYLEANGNLSAGDFTIVNVLNPSITYGDADRDSILNLGGTAINTPVAGGQRVRIDLSRPDYSYQIALTSFDRRGMFYTSGQNLEINDLTLFTDGYAVNKFKNIKRDGTPGKNFNFPDTDFPVFRLADIYLMAGEAVLRGAAGGDKAKAATYINKVRERAYGGTAGNLTAGQLDLDFVLDERARELYWECHRRTDLVRFGQLTDGTYRWDWKGGTKAGTSVAKFRNVFPIPSTEIGINPNLKQNDGY